MDSLRAASSGGYEHSAEQKVTKCHVLREADKGPEIIENLISLVWAASSGG